MSTPTSFDLELQQAFDAHTADDIIRGVKTTVSNRFARLDRHVRVRWTDYFNHTLAPDMVLSWPRENRERHVFLRANADDRWLFEDLQQPGSRRAIILALANIERPGPRKGSDLRSAAEAAETLVTDPRAIDAFDDAQHSAPVARLLSQAVVQGGRGVVGARRARKLAAATAAGFSGAGMLDDPTTRAATDLMLESLEPRQAGRMTRMLQAVWEGHGGSLADFPGQPDFNGPLTDEDLEFLLQSIETDDLSFWFSVGRTLSVEQLSRLRLDDDNVSLQHLVRANMRRLQAKAVRVRNDLAAEGPTPRWLVDQGRLAVRGRDWTAYVAATSVEQLPSSDDRDWITLETLRARTGALRVPVGNLQVVEGDVSITYEKREPGDLFADSRLVESAASIAVSRVNRATVSLPGQRSLVCEFPTRTATGHTNALFGLAELVGTGVPLLIDLPDHELHELDTLLESYEDTTEARLFDDVEVFNALVAEGGAPDDQDPSDDPPPESQPA